MASNQTEHYGLNQWAGTDDFLREEFNEDNRKVEEALGVLEGRIRIEFGTYTGTGEVPQRIPLHTASKFLMVLKNPAISNENTLFYFNAALLLPGGNHFPSQEGWIRYAANGTELEAYGHFAQKGMSYICIYFI